MITTIMGVLLIPFVAGCTVKMGNPQSSTTMGSHTVVVKPGSSFTSSSSASAGNSSTYSFTSGDITVKIQNNVLIVNNVTYGTLAAGPAGPAGTPDPCAGFPLCDG